MTIDTTIPPHITPPAAVTGCWGNFVDGASKTVNWCGRQISYAGNAVWGGIQKIASLAANFFQRAAYHVSMGFNAAVSFVKANSNYFLIGTLAAVAAAGIALLANHFFGCCDAKATADDAPAVESDIQEHLASGKPAKTEGGNAAIERAAVGELADVAGAVKDDAVKGKKGAHHPAEGTPASAAKQRGLKV